MPLLTDASNPVLNENVNPTVCLTENVKGNEIEFPDPDTYFVLSDAGKNYWFENNETVVLSLQKGYYEPIFSLDFNSEELISISQEFFGNTKIIEGDAKRALELAMKKSAKKKPSLKNRY